VLTLISLPRHLGAVDVFVFSLRSTGSGSPARAIAVIDVFLPFHSLDQW
jgi:hypothetical protein